MTMKILTLSGSLRRASINSALLRATALVAPVGMEIFPYPDLGMLPLFNPDLEPELPAPVAHLKQQIDAADALMIASPEYAHGVTGVMKNALDWLVGTESFVNKPVVLLNASPRAHHAHDALLETLRMMSAHIIEDACQTLPVMGSGLDAAGIAADEKLRFQLLDILRIMQAEVTAQSMGMASI